MRDSTYAASAFIPKISSGLTQRRAPSTSTAQYTARNAPHDNPPMNSVYDGVHRTLLIGIQYDTARPVAMSTAAAIASRSMRHARESGGRHQAAASTPNSTLAVAATDPTIPSESLPMDAA